MATLGIIFSNIHDKNIPELTSRRTMASVPFACRYRLIDFPLSNMVNSNIINIGVITHYNYQSLMDHIGTGKDWDLARRSGGIKILPPFISAYANNSNGLYNTRLEALMSINAFIGSRSEEYVIMSDCDSICNMDFSNMIDYHIESGAELTFAVKKMPLSSINTKHNVVINSDEENNITEIYNSTDIAHGTADINMNIWVANKKYLQLAMLDAIAHNYTSFTHDVVARNIGKVKMKVYHYDGYYDSIDSMADYFQSNMAMLDPEISGQILSINERPIFTKVRNSPPTRYADTSKAKNSLIADGCIIEGSVENSILFRGVKIGKDSVVKNSILMQDTVVGEGTKLNCVICDKNVIIRDSRILSGHETRPFYIDKNAMV